MTDPDDTIAQRYRELAREEPRAAVDDAILAASRRAVAARPVGARRWAAPVSIAAVLVLGFGVTFHMQREEADIATSVPQAPAPTPLPQTPSSAPASEAAPAAATPPSPRAMAPPREQKSPKAVAAPQPTAAPSQSNAAPLPPIAAPSERSTPARTPSAFPQASMDTNIAPAAPPAESPAPASNLQAAPSARMAPRMKAESADAVQQSATPGANAVDPAILRELERIARLRDEGHAEEADKALEQFRRDHSGYRIPEALWPRVRPR